MGPANFVDAQKHVFRESYNGSLVSLELLHIKVALEIKTHNEERNFVFGVSDLKSAIYLTFNNTIGTD
jgi:hypothetical protein